MAKYLARACRWCRNYLGIVIAEPEDSDVQSIRGRCGACGYEIAWELIRS